MKIIENLSYGASESNVLVLYVSERENAPVFIYFHGGGLCGGSYKGDVEKKNMEMLARMGITAVSAEYRMYPEAKFPDFIEDGAAVVRWVMDNIGNYTSYSGIFVGGSSAGGYISQMLCFDSKYLEAQGIKQSDISGYVHDAGQPTTHFNVLRERGFCNTEDEAVRRVIVDDAAPIYYIDGKQEYVPMHFIVSDNDMPNRYEQTMLMVSSLKNYGYDMDKIKCSVMENTTHCSYNWEYDENSVSKLVYLISKFINDLS